MNCKVCSKLMDDYVAESLTGDVKAMFDEHVSSCDPCKSALSHLKRFTATLTSSLAATTGMLRLRADVEATVLDAIENEPGQLPFEDMMKLFETLTFRERWAKIMYGLKQPRETGDYKWAHLQITRLWSPAMGVAVPLLAVLLAVVLGAMAPAKPPAIEVRIQEQEIKDELKEIEKLPEPEVIPDPENIVEPTDNFIPSTSISAPGPDADFSPQPAQFDSVAIIRSPVVMKGVFGSRSPGARGSALGKFGGGGHTEGAVLRALRWLKKYQETDGSWKGSSGNNTLGDKEFPEALTSLALLTFLAHGEVPGTSPEFGKTVEKAIKWLLERQGANGYYAQTGGSMDYTHPMVTYALCEAYGMTKMPQVKSAAEKALEFMYAGQQPTGGWNYGCKLGSDRIDVSITSWCVQALKAAKIAGLSPSKTEEALKKSKDAFTKVLYDQQGGHFIYHNQASYKGAFHGLTGAAVLSLQLMGQGNSPEARCGLEWLGKNASCDWAKPWGESPLYFWYYITQAKFHTGGETWKNWNKQFSMALVKNQIVIPKAIETPAGKQVDIGYWTLPKQVGECYDGKSFVYATTLCALQLQVYYRYLPTFQKPEELAADARANADQIVEAKDLDVQVNLDGVPLQ